MTDGRYVSCHELLSWSSMPKHPPHLLEWAKRGAAHRYQELKSEMAALVRHFPHLSARRTALIDLSGDPAALIDRPRKRHRRSAASRARMSAGQEARWATRK